jgi:hypothetical protein
MSEQYTSLQNALLSVELAQRDLAHAWRAWEGGEWREFVMRVKWAHGQLQSAIARLENEKEPERK